MQSTKIVIFIAAITMAVTTSFAEVTDADRKIPASKAYVDTIAETKQDVMSEGTPGAVVTYDGVDDETGQTYFSEREIYDGADDYDEANYDNEKLVTAGIVYGLATSLENIEIPDNRFTCHNTGSCTLWEMPADDATRPLLTTGTLAPLTQPSCAATGDSCTTSADCCSGACLSHVCIGDAVIALCIAGGDTCNGQTPCCDGYYCPSSGLLVNRTCTACKASGASCQSNDECCSGTCTSTGGRGQCSGTSIVSNHKHMGGTPT